MPFLSPTSKGTHFRESPPRNDISDRPKGRVLLQIHQILHLFQEYGIELREKPCLILEQEMALCHV